MPHRKIKLTPALKLYLDKKGASFPGRKEHSANVETKASNRSTHISAVSRRVKVTYRPIFPEQPVFQKNKLKKEKLTAFAVLVILLIIIFLISAFIY